MSCQLETIEGMKNKLKQQKQVGKTNLDFYTHMKSIFNRIMLYHRHDSYDKLEEISQLIKKTHLKIKDPLRDISEYRELIKQHNEFDEGEGFIEQKLDCNIEELPSVMKMFENSGISFGEQETYRIYKSMKKLAASSGATRLRFWGKFLGRERDYFILEGELPYDEEIKDDSSVEARGKGVNANVYWATTDLHGDWIQLPDADPKHIIAAREIKYIATGNLNADLNTNPKYPGKERHFLRSQIARISHTTTLVPAGFMGPHEENERDIVHAEEFTPPVATGMTNLENW